MSDDVFKPWEGSMPDNRASTGGPGAPKPIPYDKPPADVPMKQSPGLGGSNHGNNGTQGRH